MSGFSAEWLSLREAADHRSRSPDLAARVSAAFAGRDQVAVVDLGCGTGSNLRATAPLLGPRQSWTLVDHDAALLAAARERLARWADRATPARDALVLVKAGLELTVRFREADLNRDLEFALGRAADLVTASAFFDLASTEFIGRVAAAIAERRAAFYTVLTYNGRQGWTPAHASDAAMAEAFHAHQLTDKGLGRAAGPNAPAALAVAFRKLGYAVSEADSPWRLGAEDERLLADLVPGFAAAAAETGAVANGAVAAWRTLARTGAVVGHTDTWARPA